MATHDAIGDVVHLPKAIFGSCEFGGFRGSLRIRMNLGEREIAKDKGKVFAEVPLEALHNWIGVAAMRTLVVAVFNQDNGSVWIALEVVGGGDGYS